VTLYRRGSAWYVYYREDGRSRRLRASPKRREAERIAAEINAQISAGVRSTFGYDKISVEAVVPRWLEYQELVQRCSIATIDRYRSAILHLLRFVRATRPNLTIDRLTTDVAEEFVRHLRTVKISPNGSSGAKKRLMKDKGVLHVLRTCRTLVNYAARHRHMPPYATNPFTDLRIERMKIEDKKRIVLFTQAEEAAFLQACPPWEFRVFFTLAFTGMRPGEPRHLLVEDVDLGTRTAHVRCHPDLGWHTKTRNERRFHLFDELLGVIKGAIAGRSSGPVFLARRYANRGDAPPLHGVDRRDLALEYGRRVEAEAAADRDASRRRAETRAAKTLWHDMGMVNPNAVRKRFMVVAKKLGRPEMTSPYVFRHGMATAMQEADVDPFVRKEIIGHTSLEMTGRYTHTASVTLARGMKQAAELRQEALEVARHRMADGALARAAGA
jgi:integrase